MRRLYLVVMSALLLLILFAATSIGTMYAASKGNSVYSKKGVSSTYYTCGGTCENKDPYHTGCSKGAYRANYQANALVRVEDWYSPKCGTNWNITYLNGPTDLIISIYRLDGSPSHCYPENCYDRYTRNITPLWTNMVVAPVKVAEAHAHIYKPKTTDIYVDA
jgi:hypothetical protein